MRSSTGSRVIFTDSIRRKQLQYHREQISLYVRPIGNHCPDGSPPSLASGLVWRRSWSTATSSNKVRGPLAPNGTGSLGALARNFKVLLTLPATQVRLNRICGYKLPLFFTEADSSSMLSRRAACSSREWKARIPTIVLHVSSGYGSLPTGVLQKFVGLESLRLRGMANIFDWRKELGSLTNLRSISLDGFAVRRICRLRLK